MSEPAQGVAAAIADAPRGALQRWAPGLHTLAHYRREWLLHDIVAGLVLTAVLIPVGMGYAEASGLPAIHGLYATIVPLLVYAVFGPSRIMVLGPDSTLAAVIAAIILPLAGGSAERAVALAGALALLSGACLLLISFLRLGLMADLFSKPIRIGFLNAIALTVIVGQLPKLFGFSVQADDLPQKAVAFVQGLSEGRVNAVALAIGVLSLATILMLKRARPNWPGVLVAVLGATGVSAAFDLGHSSQIAVLGPMPQGLPLPSLPWVSWDDLRFLLPGAVIIALLSFADTSVLSRALAARGRYRVSQDQEMLALGVANMGSGLFQGFSISSSASRTPVAESAGSRTQLAGVVGALAIALLLVFAPNLLRALPNALLAAVVISACLSFADVPAMLALYRQRRVEFVLAWISFLGVAFIGVIQGIVLTILLSLVLMFWNAWHPHSTTLVRVDGRKGYHDAARHPEGRAVPGLVLFRWDAQLFFANAEIFRQQVLRLVDQAEPPARWLVVVADAITQIDLTAVDALLELHRELQERGVELHFAGLKGRVKDLVARDGLIDVIGADRLAPTVGSAVNRYRAAHAVDWKDWDEG
jgi:high affinity sulfate transporter 1